VDARTGGEDVTDSPPTGTSTYFKAYYWPDGSSNDWLQSNGKKQSCAFGSCGPNKYCVQPIMPLTSDKATILSNINSMTADGYTHVNLGAVWGWRLLSPSWRNVWGGTMDTNNLPLDYHTDLMEKVMVLLTDGDNYMSSSARTAY